jgi:hypothetical protein
MTRSPRWGEMMVRREGEQMIDARAHVESLVGQTVYTLTGSRPNHILEIRGEDVMVATRKSPAGRPVPMSMIQDGVDALVDRGEVEVTVEDLGHRGAFVGAVLATLPGVSVEPSTPRRLRFRMPS